jgi:hypothetical protein
MLRNCVLFTGDIASRNVPGHCFEDVVCHQAWDAL